MRRHPSTDSPRDFLRSLSDHWFTLMSGAPSVPLAVAAFYIEPAWARNVVWLTSLFCIVLAAFLIWRTERRRVMELEKIDRADIQHMLHGRFLGNRFIYGADFLLCKSYNGKFEIEQLMKGFDQISVRAPRESIALMHIDFINSRNDTINYHFWVRDGDGKESKIEHIYQDIEIKLDEICNFGLKLDIADDYEIDDAASLRVFVKGWAI